MDHFLFFIFHSIFFIVRCGAGYRPNATGDGCDPCPYGTYQPQADQENCTMCSSGYSTYQMASTQPTDCKGKNIKYCKFLILIHEYLIPRYRCFVSNREDIKSRTRNFYRYFL